MTRTQPCKLFYYSLRALYHFLSLLAHGFLLSGLQSSAQYGTGLNRWSFPNLNEDHNLYSDLLCPDPMVERRLENLTYHWNSSYVPNDVLTLKVADPQGTLPCQLETNVETLKSQNGSKVIVQPIYKFLNLSITFMPFNFNTAKQCSSFIKFHYDEKGNELRCDFSRTTPLDLPNSLHWPRDPKKRKFSFSVYPNLANFLRNEEHSRTQFFFQFYFSIKNGTSKICKIQQYSMDIERPGCPGPSYPNLSHCGEFSCSDSRFASLDSKLIMPRLIQDPSRQPRPPSHLNPSGNYSRSFTQTLRSMDRKLLVFLTILPLVLIGGLIFGIQIFVYAACSRRSSNVEGGSSGGGSRRTDSTRSQQILQNSLNLWETIPVREPRSVSFSPVTTNIDPHLHTEHLSAEGPETPKILKSALKRKHGDPYHSTYEYEIPPSYIEATKA